MSGLHSPGALNGQSVCLCACLQAHFIWMLSGWLLTVYKVFISQELCIQLKRRVGVETGWKEGSVAWIFHSVQTVECALTVTVRCVPRLQTNHFSNTYPSHTSYLSRENRSHMLCFTLLYCVNTLKHISTHSKLYLLYHCLTWIMAKCIQIRYKYPTFL